MSTLDSKPARRSTAVNSTPFWHPTLNRATIVPCGAIVQTMETKMTLTEAEKQIDELFREHGQDFVIHAGNYPEILRALNDDIVAKMEAERAEIVAKQGETR